MIRVEKRWLMALTCLPRTRGDDPYYGWGAVEAALFASHARG